MYLFQVDIGAPLIQGNNVIGILVQLEPNNMAIFSNVEKFQLEISTMQTKRRMKIVKKAPRKRARHDCSITEETSNAQHSRKKTSLNKAD